ncbi:uncharacterized protein UHO2_06340 [Ustilago hordei]|uniref:uncharacterized protein n=1 Tax=Ustilago hordei TaxID=120017 RepID=UPI001A5B90F5|nr:uncharacterized protein UHO2_06340 [Ustilago hordei]SYW80878.1 uncharacterized protein UHO2_06340 [Ustilago hordei]
MTLESSTTGRYLQPNLTTGGPVEANSAVAPPGGCTVSVKIMRHSAVPGPGVAMFVGRGDSLGGHELSGGRTRSAIQIGIGEK